MTRCMENLEKHAGGRPSKYNGEILERTKRYLDVYREEGDIVPSLEGLSVYLNIGLSTIHKWKNDGDKQEFVDTLEMCKTKQARCVINGGLGGDFNSAISKLLLHNHGYSEKVDSTITEMAPTIIKDDIPRGS